MPKPSPSCQVIVIVTERPNKVFVVLNGTVHTGWWRTSDTRSCLYRAEGNQGLLNAALLAWEGQEHFTLTFDELEKRSQGWGAWWNEDAAVQTD